MESEINNLIKMFKAVDNTVDIIDRLLENIKKEIDILELQISAISLICNKYNKKS